LHAGVPFATEQTVPHAPQFASVARLVSQPSASTPLQSAMPAGHVSMQEPPEHAAVAPPDVVHGRQVEPHSVIDVSSAQWPLHGW
jgi:hypothetical protein